MEGCRSGVDREGGGVEEKDLSGRYGFCRNRCYLAMFCDVISMLSYLKNTLVGKLVRKKGLKYS